MDISRHWRLKSSRCQMLAVRRPVDGALVQAYQSELAVSRVPLPAVYQFEPARYVPRAERSAEQITSAYARASR